MRKEVMTWNEETTATLRQLWADPQLCLSEIATRLGTSKGAVAGKASRMGLPKHKRVLLRAVSDEAILAELIGGASVNSVVLSLGVYFARVAAIRDAAGIAAWTPKTIPDALRADILTATDNGLSERQIVANFGCSFDAVRKVRAGQEAEMIRSEFQNGFELIVIERPRPPVVLPKWVSMPIPPAKTCQWTDEVNRHQWVFCDAPVVRGSSWCECHHARVFVRQRKAA